MLYLNQQRPGPVEWPVYHIDAYSIDLGQMPQIAHGIAPLRHELVLAHHLERRRQMLNAALASGRDFPALASNLLKKIVHAGSTLSHGFKVSIRMSHRLARH